MVEDGVNDIDVGEESVNRHGVPTRVARRQLHDDISGWVSPLPLTYLAVGELMMEDRFKFSEPAHASLVGACRANVHMVTRRLM